MQSRVHTQATNYTACTYTCTCTLSIKVHAIHVPCSCCLAWSLPLAMRYLSFLFNSSRRSKSSFSSCIFTTAVIIILHVHAHQQYSRVTVGEISTQWCAHSMSVGVHTCHMFALAGGFSAPSLHKETVSYTHLRAHETLR